MNDMLLQSALRLRREGKLAEAAEIYSGILANEPAHFEALHALGILRYQGGQLEEAERLIGAAIAVRPAADALYNRACLLQKLNRTEEALTAFGAAIALKPDYAEALTNRGTLLMGQGRFADAFPDLDKAAALRPTFPQVWNNRATALLKLGRSGEALVSSDKAIAIHPGFADAWRNRGTALLAELRFADALTSFERAAAIEPHSGGAWAGRGHALTELGRLDEAMASYDKALRYEPKNADALYHRANVHLRGKRFEEVAADCRRVLAIDPGYAYVPGMLAFAELCACDWRTFEDDRKTALAALHEGKPAVASFECIALSDSPADALLAAQTFVKQRFQAAPEALWRGEAYAHSRIRVAYLSANFHDHAVARLMAGVWDGHDKKRFETIAVSFGPDDGSALRARVTKSFDHFIDVRGDSDASAAARLRVLEPDIAIDLMGYTEGSRPGILAFRPAPVQVNYLGFPGSMGAGHIDYVIADPTVIPKKARAQYSERIVYLPHCYLPNDAARAISPVPSRAEAGLPEQGFVFASFNNCYKITSEMFDLWMRLLKNVPGSVLWLATAGPAAMRNLQREAEARGVAPTRLTFAPFARAAEDHLARLTLAGLVLDTLPYNSHATACDALWAGVPMVTCPGNSFAARVAASALKAIGLPELIVASLADYESLALKLAQHPAELSAIKAKLARNRTAQALFDTARYTKSLESAFQTMAERARSNASPSSFTVPETA